MADLYSYKSTTATGYVSRAAAAWSVYSSGNPTYEVWLEQNYNIRNDIERWLEQNYTLAELLELSLEQRYSYLLDTWLKQLYGDAPELQAVLVQRYADALVNFVWLEQKYGDPLQLEAWLDQLYDFPDVLKSALQQRYGVAAEAFVKHLAQHYQLRANPYFELALKQTYLLLDEDRDHQDFDYTLTINGNEAEAQVINWDFTRSRYYGTASITFRDPEQVAGLREYDEVILSVGGTDYYFFIEGAPQESSGWNSLSYQIQAHSHTKLLGPPHSEVMTEAPAEGMASAVFATLAATKNINLVYRIADEFLPAGKLAISGETPIEFIRKRVGELNAVMQAGPDGKTLYIDYDDEVAVTDWDTVTPAATITDMLELVTTSETSDPQAGYNRFLITDQETATDNSNLVAQQIDERTEDVRLYLSPWDEAARFYLDHTGGSWVTVEDFGRTTEQKTEIIEFVDGSGRTSLPILDVVDSTWLQDDLGQIDNPEDVVLEAEHGRTWSDDLQDFSGGDSLLQITYTTRFWRWLVRDPNIEQVQVRAIREVD